MEPSSQASGYLEHWCEFFARMVRQGGPEPHEYAALAACFDALAAVAQADPVGAREVQRLLDSAGAATSSPDTMQGFVRRQPHGYAGDFEIIDRIHRHWLSPDPALVKWDHFFHAQAAPCAVRNRKAYFLRWLAGAEARLAPSVPRPELLNVGCGPARDVGEYFAAHPASRVSCTCLDRDARALAYAAQVCAPVRDRIAWRQADALRFIPAVSPHLAWSAGLFDYLNDRLFVVLLRRLWRQLAPGGELVVGNFSRHNPTRGYMAAGGWVLHERDETELVALARQAGVAEGAIHIDREAEGVNLFLHAQKPLA